MTERIPAEVFCLAEFISDELIARGWTTEEVARRMSSTAEEMQRNLCVIDLLMCVQKDNLLVGDRMFDDLARVFDVDPMYFRNLDAQWRKHPDRRSKFTPPETIFGPISRRATMRAVD